MHKTGCSEETRLVLHKTSSSGAGKHLILLLLFIIIITLIMTMTVTVTTAITTTVTVTVTITAVMHKALRWCHAALGTPYQDISHHFSHGSRLRLLLLADAPALLHAGHEEVLQLIGVMHGLAGAHCDGLLQCALQTRHVLLKHTRIAQHD